MLDDNKGNSAKITKAGKDFRFDNNKWDTTGSKEEIAKMLNQYGYKIVGWE